jgi:hypothetical protein
MSSSEPFAEPLDAFICDVCALLKKQKVLEQKGPEFQAVLFFLKDHGYSHIADDLLSVFPTISTV